MFDKLQVFKVSIPVAEALRNFKKLTEIHKDLHDAFTNIVRLEGKRIFGKHFTNKIFIYF